MLASGSNLLVVSSDFKIFLKLLKLLPFSLSMHEAKLAAQTYLNRLLRGPSRNNGVVHIESRFSEDIEDAIMSFGRTGLLKRRSYSPTTTPLFTCCLYHLHVGSELFNATGVNRISLSS